MAINQSLLYTFRKSTLTVFDAGCFFSISDYKFFLSIHTAPVCLGNLKFKYVLQEILKIFMFLTSVNVQKTDII